MQTPEGRRFRQSTQGPEARTSFDAKRMEKQTRSTKAEYFWGGNEKSEIVAEARCMYVCKVWNLHKDHLGIH